jgi:hypothetical protein
MVFKSKKFIAIISVLIAVIVLGISAGVVFAQDEPEAKPDNPILTRVAEILNIDEQQLSDAFQQAMKEEREQKQEQYLQKLIEEGVITSEQAAQYKNWMDSRPDVPILDHDRFSPQNRPMQQQWLSGSGAPLPEMN